MNKINLFFLIFFIFSACGSFKEAGKVLRNEKINNADEFLVKKKAPLVLPPDYEKIPKPGSIQKKRKNREETLKEILKVTDTENTKSTTSSLEESILDKIRK